MNLLGGAYIRNAPEVSFRQVPGKIGPGSVAVLPPVPVIIGRDTYAVTLGYLLDDPNTGERWRYTAVPVSNAGFVLVYAGPREIDESVLHKLFPLLLQEIIDDPFPDIIGEMIRARNPHRTLGTLAEAEAA